MYTKTKIALSVILAISITVISFQAAYASLIDKIFIIYNTAREYLNKGDTLPITGKDVAPGCYDDCHRESFSLNPSCSGIGYGSCCFSNPDVCVRSGCDTCGWECCAGGGDCTPGCYNEGEVRCMDEGGRVVLCSDCDDDDCLDSCLLSCDQLCKTYGYPSGRADIAGKVNVKYDPYNKKVIGWITYCSNSGEVSIISCYDKDWGHCCCTTGR